MLSKAGKVSIFFAFLLPTACLASSIPFDALRQATLIAIMGSSDTECNKITSQLYVWSLHTKSFVVVSACLQVRQCREEGEGCGV